MPMLFGSEFKEFGGVHQLSGGVSLAEKNIFKGRASIIPELDQALLRSNINYSLGTAAGRKITTFDNTVYTFSARDTKFVSMVVRAKPEAKLRAKTAELINADVERDIARTTDALRLQTRIADTPIGDLEIAQTKNGFRVGWRSREIDSAQAIARRMSLASDPINVLAGNADVMAVVGLPDEAGFIVKLRGSETWLHFASEDTPTRDLPKEWLMRAADYSNARRDFRVAALDLARARDLMGPRAHLVIDTIGDDGKVVVHLADQDPAPGSNLVEVEAGGLSVKAWVDPTSNAIHIGTTARDLPGDPASFVRQFGVADLTAIRAAAGRAGVDKVRLAAPSLERSRLVDAEQAGSARDAARDIVSDPAAARPAVDRQITGDLAANTKILEQNGRTQAIRHLDQLIDLYGSQPELTLRRGLLYIDDNQWNEALVGLDRAHRPMRSRELFFDEINHRLSNQTLPLPGRQNINRYAEFADFQDHVLTNYRDLGNAVVPEYRDNAFDFSLRMDKMPSPINLKSIDPAKVRIGDALIYRQDTPGLNNLDWSVSIDRTLQQIIEGRLGKIVELPRGDIAHFRPSAIYVPDHGIAFHKVNSASSASHFHVPTSYSACTLSTNNCSTDAANSKSPMDPVYLVVAN